MPEPVQPVIDINEIPVSDSAFDMEGPLESRLSPDQIAQLDAMNAKVFGGGEPDAAGENEKPAAAAADKPAAKAEAAPLSFDEFTPPEDAPATKDGEKPPVEVPDKIEDFKAGADLMPDAEIEKLRTQTQKSNIRELRTHYDTATTKVKELQAKLDEIAKNGTDPRIQDLERRNSELNAIVERKALDEHPFVKKTFTEPRNNAFEFGRKALEMAKMDPKSLDKVMGLDGEERVAALDQLYESIESPTLRAKVEKAVTVIEANDDQKAAFFADREANFARIQEEEKVNNARTVAEQEKNLSTALDTAVQYLAKEKGISFLAFSDKPGAEKWNEALKGDLAEAKEFLLKNTDPMKLITAVVLGMRAPRMQVGYAALRSRLAQMEATAANGRASAPKLNVDSMPRTATTDNPNENLVSAGRRVLREVIESGGR